MDKILNYLQKYKNNLTKSYFIKDEIIKIVKEVTNLDLRREDFEFSNKKIHLKTTTKVKLSILIQKEQILKIINKKLGDKIVLDIK